MNLKDLNKIDVSRLKEIDLKRTKEWLLSQPGLLINSLLIVVTIVVVFSTYNKNTETTKSLQEERVQLQERLEAIEKFNAVEKEYKSFTKNIPQTIEADQLITTLSEFAIARGVRILAFSPAKEENNLFFNVTSVEINVASEDYASIVLFMHDIESSPYLMRIGKWSGAFVASDSLTEQKSRKPRRTSQQLSDEAVTKKFIQTTVKIESVELKDV